MNKEEIITKVKSLNFPDGSYIVFGSAPLAMAGLREAHDIDFLVSSELFENLRSKGWEEIDKGKNDKPLVHDVFEAHKTWDFSSYCPSLEQLLENGTVIDGINFASLEDVRKWKVSSGRPKDLVDIKLIDRAGIVDP
ncbi:MAG: hypothetical protein WC654_04460 [Patescibacteria group bacterium]